MRRDDELNELDNPYATPRSPLVMPKAADRKLDLDHELKPFKDIWLFPRDTVRRIVAVNPALHVVLIVCLTGIGETLNRASMRNTGDEIPMAAIIGGACVFGPLWGLLSLWIGSHLIRLSGNWIGGAGNRENIKTAIAWASVPALFALVLWIPELLLFGSDMFTEATPRLDAQPMLWIPFLIIGVAELVLGVWGFVLCCNTIAEVQGFRSAWSGLGNILLAGVLGVLIVIPLIALALALVFLTRS